MKILSIFTLGLGILAGAIVLNAIVSKLGLLSWFEFIKDPSKVNIFSIIWLFILYPLGLGFTAYGMQKIFPRSKK